MSESDKTSTLARNTVAQSAPLMIGYLLSFASAPVIVGTLGLRMFGIWALTGALAQYGGLLDLGVGISLARFIAAHRDDRHACGQYMAIGWMATATVTAFLALAAIVGAAPMAAALHGLSVAEMRVVLLSSAALLSCSMISGTLAALPIGRNRMVKPNIGNALGAGVNFIFSVGSLALGAGLPGYAIANAAAGVVTVGIMAGIVLGSEGRPPLSWPHSGTLATFMSFSVKNQLVRLMNLVNYQTDKIVIALAVGPAAAGGYELANRVAIAVREIGVYASSAISIDLTTTMARSGIDRVRARYGRLTEVTASLGLPPVLLAMATAPLLLSAWLSHTPPSSVLVLVSLCAAYLLSVPTATGYGIAVAAGDPGIVAYTSVATAVANIALTVALAPIFGLRGILAGTVLALTGGAIAQVVLVQHRLKLPATAYVGAVAPALRAYALFAIPIAVVCYGLEFDDRGTEALLLVALSMAYTLACVRWARRAGRLPSALASRIPRLWGLT